MIINHKSGKGGVVGKDGTTPHIGANGNWFLGETDTGVAAQGKSDTRIETILLPVADWDGETLNQTITCSGVLEDETKQIITTVALPGNEEVCEACHIICSAFAKDTLTFTATVMPEADIYLYVILENVSGGNNATSSVYSLEETVVGTWIDGKPLYRQVIIGTAPIVATNGTFVWSRFPLGCSVDFAMPITGHLLNTLTAQYLSIPYLTNDSTGQLKATVEKANNGVLIGSNVVGWSGSPIVLFAEYTKTTDTATIDIPSEVAMMAAYEEGVNEA